MTPPVSITPDAWPRPDTPADGGITRHTVGGFPWFCARPDGASRFAILSRHHSADAAIACAEGIARATPGRVIVGCDHVAVQAALRAALDPKE